MVLDKFSLAGKVAIVTGGGQGLGKAFCRALAEAGADVVVAEVHPQTGPAVAAEIEALGRRALAVPTDVRERASVFSMVEQALAKFGRIDVLVNNAGISRRVAAQDMSEAEWQDVIDVNVNGLFRCCQAVARPMIQQRSGSIINIASMSGLIVNFPQAQASYNTSKAAVIHLTRSLAAEWAPHQIRVNAIAPGYMRTPLTEARLADPRYYDAWMAATPMKRPGEPEELGPVAVFLASPASSYVTGATIVVDGGYTIR